MRYKQYKLDTWCKIAKIRMIERDLSEVDVANGVGYSRPHVTSVLNGRLISQTARDKISDFLGIQNHYQS